jgi:hypothetical protein
MGLKEQLYVCTRAISADEDYLEFARMFHLAQGQDAPLDFLFRHYFPSPTRVSPLPERALVPDKEERFLQIASATMNLLKDLCFVVPEFGEELAKHPGLTKRLLEALRHPCVVFVLLACEVKSRQCDVCFIIRKAV